jgi:hypothetical protein
VVGRAAADGERERLWERCRELDKDLDAFAAWRPRETAVVVLEPLLGGRMSLRERITRLLSLPRTRCWRPRLR